MVPVLTEAELAELLRIEPALVARLLAETDLPRVVVAGRVRFLTAEVLAWLAAHEGPILARAPSEAASPAAARAPLPPLEPAGEEATPLVDAGALAALQPSYADAAHDLERLRARDALIALGDALQPVLMRLSEGQLRPWPEERERTTPWRAADAGRTPLHRLAMAFAAGGDGAPGFADRPRLELALTAHEAELSLRVPVGWAPRPTGPDAEAALAAGGAVHEDGSGGWFLAFRHALVPRAPAREALARRLALEAERLAPLWRATVRRGPVA